ncbi:hypothetical protein BaRGS_00015662 [Batillaria attramentaria]|uniref:Translocator protein n=1 Tax=Batillaria attramentaria TaxID=370345 RepID=A0ABD0L1B4_9CAEN
MSDYLAPALAVLLPNFGAIAGGYMTSWRIDTDWFQKLKKPSWMPPYWIFGPVWTYMYSSMGYASYLVWRDGGGFDGEAALPLTVYGVQLILNWAFTPLCFGAKSLKWGLIELVGLLGAIAGTMYTFYPVSRLAAGLLVPYFGWVTLATALTYTIWRDNIDHKD